LLCIFYLEYAIRRVKVSQDGLQFNGTHQVVVFAVYVNVMGEFSSETTALFFK
jgi:hypothetical protein